MILQSAGVRDPPPLHGAAGVRVAASKSLVLLAYLLSLLGI